MPSEEQYFSRGGDGLQLEGLVDLEAVCSPFAGGIVLEQSRWRRSESEHSIESP